MTFWILDFGLARKANESVVTEATFTRPFALSVVEGLLTSLPTVGTLGTYGTAGTALKL
jgi:hypothetical protein